MPKETLGVPQIEAAGLELAQTEFDLRETLEDVARVIAIKAHPKGLEVTADIEPAAPDRLKGDPAGLRQVLLSLGDNAVKFTHQGEIALSVKVIEADRGNARILFTVRDTGIGIAANDLDALFAPVSRLDASTSHRPPGRDLALPIVKRVVRLMSGRVGVDSREGVGSTFWFTARLGINAQSDSMHPRLSEALRGQRVLVVDDNATSRTVLAAQLRRCGIEGVCAESAEEALWALAQTARAGRAFRIALLDHRMPGCDGLELGRHINADAQLRKTRLVLLTSLNSGGRGHRLAAPGFAGYLLKPVAHRDLVNCLLLAAAMPVGEHREQNTPAAAALSR